MSVKSICSKLSLLRLTMSDTSESTSSSSSSSSSSISISFSLPFSTSSTDEVSPTEFGYCGLTNLGGTCYSNACVQALYTLNKVRRLLIESRVTGGPFHVSLGKLFHEMNRLSQHWPLVIVNGKQLLARTRPDQFNELFRQAHPEFVLGQQHDAQQFLALLLDTLHNETNQENSQQPNEPRDRDEAWLYQRACLDPGPYAQIFMGQVESQLSCISCGHRSITWSAFWQLQLEVPAESDQTFTVNDCIREFMADKILQGDCAPTCGGCNQRNGSIKKQTICQGPPYLIVHLKRFGPTGQRNDRKVPFDECLSLANRNYMLSACVMRRGTHTKGHNSNVTLFLEDDNRWVLFDDEKIQTRITNQRARKMLQRFGYVGFYRAVVIE